MRQTRRNRCLFAAVIIEIHSFQTCQEFAKHNGISRTWAWRQCKQEHQQPNSTDYDVLIVAGNYYMKLRSAPVESELLGLVAKT